MKGADWSILQDLMSAEAGIQLRSESEPMVISRLERLALDQRWLNYHEVIDRLRQDPWGSTRELVLEALLIHETSFFRDLHPFESLRLEILPTLIAEGMARRTLRCWSAACSSGQEPYSLAMLIAESFPELLSWNLQLSASDLSTEIVERARAGRFRQPEVNRGLPAPYLVKYFRREGLDWVIADELRRRIHFFEHNIFEPCHHLPPQDLIMFRNVLIYFAEERRLQALERVQQALRPGGFLILGAAEAALQKDSAFEQLRLGRTICYRRKP